MFLMKILGGFFVSLILFMPEYLPQVAYAVCCGCNSCRAGCTCGCACGDENGKEVCLDNIDKENHTATFKDKKTNVVFVMPYDDDVLKGAKVGDCGLIKTQQEQICTGFATSGSSETQGSSKSGQ